MERRFAHHDTIVAHESCSKQWAFAYGALCATISTKPTCSVAFNFELQRSTVTSYSKFALICVLTVLKQESRYPPNRAHNLRGTSQESEAKAGDALPARVAQLMSARAIIVAH